MSNNTTTYNMTTTAIPYATDEEVFWALMKYQLYIWEGGVIALVNGLMLATIGYHDVLRNKKEYIMAGSLAMADMLSGFGYFLAGCYRSYLHYYRLDAIKVRPSDCLMTAHCIVWLPSEVQSGIVLAQTTLDRVLAVMMPMSYFQFGAAYAWKMTAVFWGYDLLFMIAVVYVSITEGQKPGSAIYNQICFSTDMLGTNNFMRSYYMNSRMAGGFISVVMYLVVLVKARQLLNKTSTSSDKEMAKRMEKQRRLNITVGISTIFTFFFFCIPNALWPIMEMWEPLMPYLNTLGPISMSISNLNPCLNFFVYTSRHKDLMEAFKMMFKGEKLTKAKLDAILNDTSKVAENYTAKTKE